MLPHDHGCPQGRGRARVGVLVEVGRLGEGHQDRRAAAHGQLAEAAGASAADHQVGVLQQPRHLIAERALQIARMLQLAAVGVVATAEVHHPAARRQQLGQQGAQHAVQSHRPLAAPHHQQQRSRAAGHPGRQGGRLQKGPAHGGAGHPRPALGQPLRRLGQPHRHPAAEAPQQPGDPAGHAIGFVQHHGDAAPARRQDRRRGDVAAGAEHHADALPSDQLTHLPGGPQQSHQVGQFAQAAPLQAPGPHRVQRDAARHQFGFQPVGYPQPVQLPIGGQGLGHRQGRKQMAAGAAGCDQQAGHGGGREARLT